MRPERTQARLVTSTQLKTRTQIDDALAEILLEVLGLQHDLTDAESVWATQIAQVDSHNSASAVNLAHYWAVRQHDLRDLQPRLAAFGLSSLGRTEPHVRASLSAIATAATALAGHTDTGAGTAGAGRGIGFADGT